MKAQGTIEYLIIMGIVITISLVVVGLLSGFVGNTDSAQKLSDTITSQTGQGGTFAIKEKAMNEDGNYLLILQGANSDTLTITNIQVNDENQDYSQTIQLGQTTGFEIETEDTCTNGQTNTTTIIITYTTTHGIIKTETYTIQTNCENYSASANTTISTPVTDPPPIISLFSPTNGNKDLDGTVDFNYSLTNASSTSNCYLLINGAVNSTNSSLSEGINTFSSIDISSYSADTNYAWDVNCDTSDINYSSSNGDYNIQYSPAPTITLSEPADGNVDEDGIITFTFSLDLNTNTTQCNLLLNQTDINQLDTLLTGTNNFNDINLYKEGISVDTNYLWDVNCTKNDINYSSGNGDWNIMVSPAEEGISLASESGNFPADENISVVLPEDYNSELTYHYTWYKNDTIIAATVLTDGLEAYFPFDNDTNDYHSTNNNQTTYGSPTNGSAYGKVGNGYYFSGANLDCLKINSPTFLSNQTGTISFWSQVKVFEYDSFFAISGGSKYFKIGIGSSWRFTESENFVSPYGWITTLQTNNNVLAGNVWQHLVITSDGSKLKLYKNGSLSTLDQGSNNVGQWFGDVPSRTYALIGCSNPDGAEYQNKITAYLDEFQIFDDVLTQNEISALYYGGLYDGNVLDSSLFTTGDEIIVGYRTNDGTGWTADQNSSPITVT